MRIAYFVLGLFSFATVWSAHFYAYAYSPNGRWYRLMLALTLLAIAPLIALFGKVKRGRVLSDTWSLFWSNALIGCPRVIASSITIAFALMMVAFVRQISGSKGLVDDEFQTAALAIFVSAALSYAVTLLRTRKSEA